MLSIFQQHDTANLTNWVHEKLKHVLLCDGANNYNVCGKMFIEMQCWATTLPVGAEG